MYGTIAEADTYFLTKVKHEVWDDASTGDKTRALENATTLIDRLNFLGSKTAEDQTNEFPRDRTDDATPPQVEYATYELAYALLDGRDPELESESLGLESASLSPVKAVFSNDYRPAHIVNGIVSMMAWSYLRPYLRANTNLRLHRVN